MEVPRSSPGDFRVSAFRPRPGLGPRVGAPAGASTGSFDPVMSGACRFSCATKTAYEEKDVIAQPGAEDGRLTRCPVSGVLFTVDAGRPHGKSGGHEYVFCCDQCRARFA